MTSNGKVLITGGNGNLGRLVAQSLENAGHAVISFDLPGTTNEATAARYRVIESDIRDVALLEATLQQEKPEAIIHLASLLSGSSETDPAAAWAINATASVDLMRLATEHLSGPFVFASTLATYGADVPDPLPLDTPQWPETIYGVTKIAAERMGVYLARTKGLDFRCLRFPQVLSPFAPTGAMTAYPSHAFRAALQGAEFTFPVRPETSVSNLFLLDVVASLVGILQADRNRLRHPAYNLHAYPLSAREVAQTLQDRFPDFTHRFEPDPQIQAMIDACPTVLDSSAAREDWDWAPAFDFAHTVETLIQMIRGDNATPPPKP